MKDNMQKNNIERDPVCGMKIDKEKCELVSVYDGKEYHFCTANCKEAFELAPEKYAIKGKKVNLNEASLKDLEEMLRILTVAIEIQGRERDFFAREASNTQSQIAKALFSELADNLNQDLDNLVSRKKRIVSALEDLHKVKGQDDIKEDVTLALDPVCGMKVNKLNATYSSVYKGKEYYFCSEGCKRAFDQAPEKYVPD